ncbi:MAG: metal ABC transporter permease [Myxococcales bacterium]|nr:metal ABC transporter permease [Myxococcales bacterium]
MSGSLWWLADAFSLGWFERVMEALRYYPMQIATSACIGAALGVLGCFVVLRRMALIGDALSHAILPGVVFAFIVMGYFTEHLDGLLGVWGLFFGALLAGLLTAVSISWISRHARAKDDSAIGIVFTAMFALGVVMISLQPKGTHFDLTCFLFGLPLAIKTQDMVSIAIVAPAVLLYVVLGYRGLKILSFDPQLAAAVGIRVDRMHYVFMGFLAATVVAALRTVGVIMSVAMLITPAATAYQLTNRLSVMLVLSGFFGAFSATMGFLLAFLFNIPTGPAMVLVATALFLLALFFGPEYGLFQRMLRRRQVRLHIAEEDVIKALVMQKDHQMGESALFQRLEITHGGLIHKALAQLLKEGFVKRSAQDVALSQQGIERGLMLVRAHRIWESYLASQQVPLEQLHEMAERLEHAHELTEDLAEALGHPEIDPHGSPIPPKSNA